MAHEFWTQPAILYVAQELEGGPPRLTADQQGPLNWLIEMAINNNPVPLAHIMIGPKAGGDKIGPADIIELAKRRDRPNPAQEP